MIFLLPIIQIMLAQSVFAQTAAVSPNEVPRGGSVVAGRAAIVPDARGLRIEQGSARAVIDWQRFDVGADSRVHFAQGSREAATLNRVLGGQESRILGQLSADGQVFLSNPAGVVFGRSARVDVGGLVATTLRIDPEEFMAGRSRFLREGSAGRVINEGELRASLGGYIALLAPEVRNEGVIIAHAGTVALAAGDQIELQVKHGSLSSLRVEPSRIRALVESRHAVEAPGGWIVLSASAANALWAGVVRVEGSLSASSLTERGGRIVLEGDEIRVASGSVIEARGARAGGAVLVGGDWQGGANPDRRVFADPNALRQAREVRVESGSLIDASALEEGPGGTVVLWSDVRNPQSLTSVKGEIAARGGRSGGAGGWVETSGRRLQVEALKVDTRAPRGPTGHWLLDPVDITIAASGGDITHDAVSTALESNHVTIATAGSGACTGVACSFSGTAETGTGTLRVQSPIAAFSANTLTLEAAGPVSIEAPITLGGALAVTGPAGIAIGADILTAGNQTYSGVVSLASGVTLDASGRLDTQVYPYSASVQTQTIDGSAARVRLVGGAGGRGGEDLGGAGFASGPAGDYTATLFLEPGTALEIAPGGGGGAGRNGANAAGGGGGTNRLGIGNGGAGGNSGGLLFSGSGGGGGAASVIKVVPPLVSGNLYVFAGGAGGGAGQNLHSDSENEFAGRDSGLYRTGSFTGEDGPGAGFFRDGSGSGGGGGGLQGGQASEGFNECVLLVCERQGRGGNRGQSGATPGVDAVAVVNTSRGVTSGNNGEITVTVLQTGGPSPGTISMEGLQTAGPATLKGATVSIGAGGGQLAAGTLGINALSPTVASAIAASLSGAGGITKHGPGTLSLSGSNTFTGDTQVMAGTLVVASTEALSGSRVWLADSADVALQIDTHASVRSLEGAGAAGGEVRLGSYQLTVGENSREAFSGRFTGSPGRLRIDAGQTGTFTWSSASDLRVGVPVELVSGTLSLHARGSLYFDQSVESTADQVGLRLCYGCVAGVPTDVDDHDFVLDFAQRRSITLSGSGVRFQAPVSSTDVADFTVLRGAELAVNPATRLLDPQGRYALVTDVDLSQTVYPEAFFSAPNGAAAGFGGRFYGLGHSISNLYLRDSGTGERELGLFARLGPLATVRDLGVENLLIQAAPSASGAGVRIGGIAAVVSAQAGGSQPITLASVWSTGLVQVSDTPGVEVAELVAGGLVGLHAGNHLRIARSYSTLGIDNRAASSSTSKLALGGLVGASLDRSAGDPWAAQATSTQSRLTIEQSYATSALAVSDRWNLSWWGTGLLVGATMVPSSVTDAFSIGTLGPLKNTTLLGGVVGAGTPGLQVARVYTNETDQGGWASHAQVTPGGFAGTLPAGFSGPVWSSTPTYPLLAGLPAPRLPLFVGSDATVGTYGSVAAALDAGRVIRDFRGVAVDGLTVSGSSAVFALDDRSSADTYTDAKRYLRGLSAVDPASGLAYVLTTYGPSSFTVEPAPLQVTVTNTAVSKVYDGSTSAPAGFEPTFSLTGFVAGDSAASLSYTGAVYNSPHVLAADRVTVNGLAIAAITGSNNSRASDYALVAPSASVAAQITPRLLTVSANKVYDGDTALSAGQVVLGNRVTGETLTVVQAQASDRSVLTPSKFVQSLTLGDGSGGGRVSNYRLPELNAGNAPVVITPRPVTLTATPVTKSYDGTRGHEASAQELLEMTRANDLAPGDQVKSARLIFADKNAGSGKSVILESIELAHGSGGARADDNYRLTLAGNDASIIERRDSVTWVGGSQGEWFDPANWALTRDPGVRGSVPDRANVREVVIPEGTSLRFDERRSTGVAEAGQVSVETLLFAGARVGSELDLVNGSLSVGTARLGALTGTRQARLEVQRQLEIEIQTATRTVESRIEGAGTLIKSGPGTLILSGETAAAGSHSGITRIEGGTLVLEGDRIELGGSLYEGPGNLVIRPASGAFSQEVLIEGDRIGETLGSLSVGRAQREAGPLAIGLAGRIATAGQQVYHGAVGLRADTSLRASTVQLQGEVQGNGHRLDLLGDIETRGILSGLASLTASGTVRLGADVQTTGAQAYRGTLVLAGSDRRLVTGDADVAIERLTNDGVARGLTADLGTGTLSLARFAPDREASLSISSSGPIQLGSIDADQMTIRAGGPISQQPDSRIRVSGPTVLEAQGADERYAITLDVPGNDFVGAFAVTASSVSVRDELGGLVFGDSWLATHLEATSMAGAITQRAGERLIVVGYTRLQAGAEGTLPILLEEAANRFLGGVQARGDPVRITGDLRAAPALASPASLIAQGVGVGLFAGPTLPALDASVSQMVDVGASAVVAEATEPAPGAVGTATTATTASPGPSSTTPSDPSTAVATEAASTSTALAATESAATESVATEAVATETAATETAATETVATETVATETVATESAVTPSATEGAAPAATEIADTAAASTSTEAAPVSSAAETAAAPSATETATAPSAVETAAAPSATSASPVTETQSARAAADAAPTSVSATSLSGADSPAQAVDALSATLAQSALQAGATPAEAAQASETFAAVLANKLARGVPADEAVAQARQAFQESLALPAAKTPGDAAARSLTSGGAELAATLDRIAQASTPEGGAAFDRALSAALARGLSFEAAVKSARAAVEDTERALRADDQPSAVFSGASAAPVPFAQASPELQRALGSLLERGMTPAEALARAERAQALEAATARADLNNAASPIASGNHPLLTSQPRSAAFDRALAAALARGDSPAAALARAQAADREQARLDNNDDRSPVVQALKDLERDPQRSAREAIILAHLARGMTLAQALERAGAAGLARAATAEPDPASNPRIALASGLGVPSVPVLNGRSQTYRRALGNALARGDPVEKARAIAERMEEAATVRLPMPPEIRALVARNPEAVRVSLASSGNNDKGTGRGEGAPDWIRLDHRTGQFVAVDIPQAGLPVVLLLTVGKERYAVTVSEVAIPGVAPVAKLP